MLKQKDGKFIVRLAPTTYIYVVGMAVLGPMQLIFALDNLRGWVWVMALMGVVCTLAAGLGLWMILLPRTVVDPTRRCIDWGARVLSFDAVAQVQLTRVRDTDSESWHVSVLTTAAQDVFRERAARLEERVGFASAHPEQGITPEQVKRELHTLDTLLRRGIHEVGNADSERKARSAAQILARLMDVPLVDATVSD